MKRAFLLVALAASCGGAPPTIDPPRPDLAAPPTVSCSDRLRNDGESDVDCGGSQCPKCDNDALCGSSADCKSGICLNNVCRATDDMDVIVFHDMAPPPPDLFVPPDMVPITCADGVKNGGESSIDCGGPSCGRCNVGAACMLPGDCVTSLCVGNLCIAPPTCTDAQLNFAETDVDCGGPLCGRCAIGKQCFVAGDCVSGLCLDGVCTVAFACNDGKKNGQESGIDCGGPVCLPCGAGQMCSGPGDCASRYCPSQSCVLAPSCSNGLQDLGESDTDCGGSCPACGAGRDCISGGDCESGVCTNQLCVASSCGDGAKNQAESGIDCGGPCGACNNGGACRVDADCASQRCINTVCRALPTCSDGLRNQNETDVDCGGACPSCAPGGRCLGGADCDSLLCTNNRCTTASCSDQVQNQDESSTDCGGTSCARCAADQGNTCLLPRDCVGDGCVMGVCLTPSCSDSVRDGDETDQDCGGPSCADCAAGQMCLSSGDCSPGDCSGGVCQPATCSDSKINQGETDLNCGGLICPDCATGQMCLGSGDCSPGDCLAGVCRAASCGDSKRNQDETDLNCGGTLCTTRCATGQMCLIHGDCSPGDCSGGACQAASCADSKKNQDETDVNCGGAACATRCAVGQMCLAHGDCAAGDCVAGICRDGSCSDSKKNQDETDVNCGGAICATRCSVGQMCLIHGDCTPGDCIGGVCRNATCFDSKQNQDESDVNCGGAICSTRCQVGQTCNVHADCTPGDCHPGTRVCLAASCFDGKKNQDETDVNCGGAICSTRCQVGQTCNVHADCTPGDCNVTCQPPSCFDTKINGDETDLNCGGFTCMRCTPGQLCVTDTDCTGLCNVLATPHVCLPETCFDGKKNQNESHADCGGATCAARCANLGTCVVDGDCQSNLCVAGICHQVIYAAPQPISTGSGSTPLGVAVGLLNADPFPDIVSANPGSGNLSILLGDAAGTFTAAPPLTLTGTNSVAIADFNGDGIQDIATTAGNGLAIFYGVGDGTFGPSTFYPAGSYPAVNLVVADYTSDGRPDVVVGDYDTLWMFVNNGSSGFMRTISAPLSNFAYGIGMAAGDFNGDGKTDLVTGGGSSACVSNGMFVYLGTGNANGSLTFGGVYGLGGPCGFLAITLDTGDLDGGGTADIVGANAYSSYYTRAFPGVGNGTFPSSSTLPFESVSLIVRDVNQDGVLDIVSVASEVKVFVGRGNGSFRDPVTIAPPGTGKGISGVTPFVPRSIAAADFNLDGKLDLVVADTVSAVNVLINISQ